MKMKRALAGTKVDSIKGNIALMKGFDAVVNAANAWLRPGGGVAGAIHQAAGLGLVEECRKYAPIAPGEAVLTPGFGLPNRYVIHCLGPVYGKDEPSAELLAQCYRNALKLAEEHGISSIAFPVISTGAFGYPFGEAVQVILRTLQEVVPTLSHVEKIVFVVRSPEKHELLRQELEKYF